MKRPVLALSRRYQAALHRHLKPGSRASVNSALQLGHCAVTLGLETLDVARIHKTALAAQLLPNSSLAVKAAIIKSAGIFFAEAITPIEKTHRAGVEATADLKRQRRRLNKRNAQLAAANRNLKRGVSRRKAAEVAVKKSGRHHAKLLKEARRLQRHLQRLTHRILSAQEDENRKLSIDLRDDISQTLLGINVRLLTLKRGVMARTKGLAKEIATAQRLVEQSIKAINQFARECVIQHEA
jgi:signal transduction histidine kinase